MPLALSSLSFTNIPLTNEYRIMNITIEAGTVLELGVEGRPESHVKYLVLTTFDFVKEVEKTGLNLFNDTRTEKMSMEEKDMIELHLLNNGLIQVLHSH